MLGTRDTKMNGRILSFKRQFSRRKWLKIRTVKRGKREKEEGAVGWGRKT